MADQISGGLCRPVNRLRWRLLLSVHLLERAVEAIQNTIELDPHLKGQCIAGDVVWWNRRSAGISEIVRMILRLEHIQNVRPERLCRFHHPRSRRITFARDLETARRAHNYDAVLDESVDELRRRRKIRLVSRQNVPARIAPRRIV